MCQLQGTYAERIQALEDQTAIIAKNSTRGGTIDENRKEIGLREINERKRTGDSRQRG